MYKTLGCRTIITVIWVLNDLANSLSWLFRTQTMKRTSQFVSGSKYDYSIGVNNFAWCKVATIWKWTRYGLERSGVFRDGKTLPIFTSSVSHFFTWYIYASVLFTAYKWMQMSQWLNLINSYNTGNSTRRSS